MGHLDPDGFDRRGNGPGDVGIMTSFVVVVLSQGLAQNLPMINKISV
jgi:hypothetical protein